MRRAGRKILLGLSAIGGLLAALVIACLLYLTYGDLARFKPRIETIVSEALGRDFRIDGDFDLKVLPRIAAVASDVTLANAEWASAEPMLAIGRVAAEVDLWSVLRGAVVIERVEFDDSRVLVEWDADGRSNMSFGEPEAAAQDATGTAAGSAERGLPVVVDHAAINSLDIVARQPGGEDFEAVIESLQAEIGEDDSFTAVLAGFALEHDIDLNARIDPAGALQTGGGVSYRVDAATENAEFSLTGDVDSLQTLFAGDLSAIQLVGIDGSVASLEQFGAAFDV